MLQTKQLQFSYNRNQVMNFPDISLQKAEHWLLLGQSGSGKTTLLHLLGGLLSPTNGSIVIGDTEVGQLRSAALDRFRGKNIGIVFQKSHFVRALTIGENLALAQQLAGLKPNRERILELLERLNIADKYRLKPDRLSTGEQQRAAIARALVNHAPIILADEPTSALDDHNAQEVINLLEEQARAQGSTLLVVTHDKRLKDRFPNQIEL
ncbi:MAG TPA: ATP-binding cassette domain-containing protein [Haliscomenobacter sp.]|uniref:ABC transporter ATP-binding protein n=1 Tax=Haliscomenobacter sp. TaxID=2717303 RepID=UPI001D76602F|nr:ATP-binding cassette domain-containing protein [Haliscomenobacter sp.]MBK9487738.1 ATP-binding cassette domain-containing protein [Haliscomenobacter sp.]HOY17762.1 ATP-binding cassette domain-containing protein [Haliscomenobacter sp.]HPH21534.1 ATP-binding cassette domain-containing protein [Haliscomenobacter sp.]